MRAGRTSADTMTSWPTTREPKERLEQSVKDRGVEPQSTSWQQVRLPREVTCAGRTSAVTVVLEVGVQGEPPLSPYLLPTKQNETMRAMVSVGVLPTPGVVPAQSRYDES